MAVTGTYAVSMVLQSATQPVPPVLRVPVSHHPRPSGSGVADPHWESPAGAGERGDALVGQGVAGADRKTSRVLALDRAGRLADALPDDVQAGACHGGRGHPEVAAVRPVGHPLPSVGASGGGARLHRERGRAGPLDRYRIVRVAVRAAGRAADDLAVDRDRVPEDVGLAAVGEPDARGQIGPDRCRDAPAIGGQVRLLAARGGSRAAPGRAGQDGRDRGDGCDQHLVAHR